jgi:hypothetical protein
MAKEMAGLFGPTHLPMQLLLQQVVEVLVQQLLLPLQK